MFQIEHLTFQYALAEEKTLKDLSFEIKEGTITLLIGPSGSGKSTLLRHLKKELMPRGKRQGDIYYRGRRLQEWDAKTSVSEIGYLFQDPSKQMVMDTVWHEIAFGMENLGMSYKKMRRTVAELVNYFNLQKLYRVPCAQLSGGEKQMVNLASLAAMRPKVLILDEPTAQLDPVGRKDFLSMLEKLHREFQMTIIIAAHDLEDLMEKADQCIFMEQGCIREIGTPEQVIQKIWEKRNDAGDLFPEMIRLSEKFCEKPEFSISVIREAMKKMSYETILPKKENEYGAPVICIQHLYAGYGRDKILMDLSVDVRKKEFFTVLGANGSGKTTLMRCMTGRLKYNGKIRMKRRFAYLPQDPTILFVKDRLLDDLCEGSAEKEKYLDELIDLCDLREQLDQHPYDLSGGQQQMAALIKVLLREPEILLLDEPTKGMDRSHKLRFGELLRGLCDGGMAILCVTHDMEFAAAFSDRVGMLFDGKLEAADQPENFFTDGYFYTTTTAKVTRGMEQQAILPENVRRI